MSSDKIFKAYDIRGIYPTEVDADIAYKIGRALVKYLKCKKILVTYDMRDSSPELFEALKKGIMDQGADVVDAGLCSTPMFYFASSQYNAGITVTASHNPKEYNGFKICREKAIPIGAGLGMEELQDLVMKNEFDEPDKKGSEEKIDVMDDYINYNLSYLNCNKKYKIVVDAGNGMAGYTFPKTFDKIENIEYIPMYFELDVSFPNHEANPLKTETVVALQKKVLDEGADLGIAFDGDADRAMFIDEKGNYISADFTTCLLGLSILKNDPGALLLRDLRSSRTVTKTWLDAGAKTNKCRVGHSLIKAQMIKEGAIFAGELSGHYYFKHKVNDITFFCENAIVATILILNLLAEKNKKMSELVAPLRKYYQSGEINSKVEDKVKKIQELQEKYNDGEITHLDGISVDYDDWWFNVRPSNTENLLRLNVEASTKELMEEKRDELLKIIQRG